MPRVQEKTINMGDIFSLLMHRRCDEDGSLYRFCDLEREVNYRINRS